jgi:hypothetical protein
MPYESETRPDGSVLIKDVLIMGTATKAQRPDWGMDITPGWLQTAAANAATLAQVKDFPLIFDGHTATVETVDGKRAVKRRDAPVVGRVLNARFDAHSQTIKADLWLTDSAAVATWRAGGFPKLSPEFWPKAGMLKGVAMLRSEPPHFESFPDLSPKEFFERMPVSMASAVEGDTQTAAGSRIDTEVPMELSAEQIAEIAKQVAPAVIEGLKPQLEAHASKPVEDADYLADVDKGVKARMAEIEQKHAAWEREKMIEAHAAALEAAGVMSKPRAAKVLEKCRTDEGITLKTESLLRAASSEVQMEFEKVAGPQTIEAAMASAWDNEFAEQFGDVMTKEEWIAKNKGKFTLEDFKNSAHAA